MLNESCTVISNRQLTNNVYELILTGELVTTMKEPGQFVHVKVSNGIDPLLRRPISIANVDTEHKQFTLIFRVEGKGTSILSTKKKGDCVDILGPLGNGFPVDKENRGRKALLVGGGIGVPPLYELSKQLINIGINVEHVLGFGDAAQVFYEKEFAEFGPTYITTDDGSYGKKGYVSDLIREKSLEFDLLYSCGPTPMLRSLENKYSAEKIVYLSLEERMGCGIGACFACVCHTANDPSGITYKKICSDGPVFRAGEVVL